MSILNASVCFTETETNHLAVKYNLAVCLSYTRTKSTTDSQTRSCTSL